MRIAWLGVLLSMMVVAGARAQMPMPEAAAPDGARLFRNQCATCHTLKASEPVRQGPNLEHVLDRRIGGVKGYRYTDGYRESDQAWTEATLDRYLINPQAMFPGSTMAYRQPKAEVRATIIAYLRDQE